jgi:arylsulfatase A-like enzyme
MTNPPNILFISIDDLNDWVGVLGGYPGVKTPNIDRLAGRGTLFSNAQTPVPACNGARTAVLTGLQPNTTGIYSNVQDWRLSLSKVTTLPEYFRQNGYEVVGAGKIFHDKFNKPKVFDKYFPLSGSPSSPDNSGPIQFGPINNSIEDMADAKTANFAKEYLEQDHSKPFFFALGIVKPHTDLSVPKEFFDLYPLKEVKLPNVKTDDLADVARMGKKLADPSGEYQQILDLGQDQEIVQAYLAAISFADAMIGRVLDALYSSSYADNTIVVLWSDNGWHLGEKLHWTKETLWEEATRVPLIISAPGIADSGEVSPQAVSLLDLYPTLLDLAGLAPKNDLEGESLLPLLNNPHYTRETPAISFWGHSFSVRTERWRYIQYFGSGEELYDHDNDPNEWTNLARDPQYESIKKELAQWLPSTDNRLLGNAEDNLLRGSQYQDVLFGFTGDDRLIGKEGNDQIFGMAGNDTLRGGEDEDFLLDYDGSNVLKGDGGDDIIFAGLDDDKVIGGAGKDLLYGGKGKDIIRGNSGNDIVDNTLKSDAGDDLIKGDGGNDRLIDDLGNDTLYGGKGNDTLKGGAGSDVFLLNPRNRGVDTIVDFESSDKIIIISSSDSLKQSNLPVVIKPEQFVLGSRAQEPDDIVIYNSRSSSLFFDPDGSGPKEKISIAILKTSPNVNADNIAIFS